MKTFFFIMFIAAPKVVSEMVASSLKILMSSTSQSNGTLTSAAVKGLGQVLTLPGVLTSEDMKTSSWCILEQVLNSEDKVVR